MSSVSTWPKEQERPIPHNIEAEQALLGALLVNNDAYDKISDFLSEAHFFDDLHGEIFSVACKMITDGSRASPITLKPYFGNHPPIKNSLTVPQYLGRLVAAATTVIHAREYGQTIYDLALRRTLMDVGEQMVQRASLAQIDHPPREIVEETEQRLFQLVETGRDGARIFTMEDMLGEAVDSIANAYKRDGKLAGIASGFLDLDGKIGGLVNGDLIIIAGRPSMGKTALATNIAYNVAEKNDPEAENPDDNPGRGVAFFSLEMSALQQSLRLVSSWCDIPSDRLRRGAINEAEFNRIVEQAEQRSAMPFYLDQAADLTVSQLKARARRLKRQKGIGLIVVDYLQLMKGTNRRDNRTAEITEITRGLKNLAMDLNVPVIALSQLSRDLERRDDKRPQLSDLRESGSIEQDADVVMFVYRDDYYIERRQPGEATAQWYEWKAEMEAAKGRAEIIIAKQRQGPTGTITLRFDDKHTKFENFSHNTGGMFE